MHFRFSMRYPAAPVLRIFDARGRMMMEKAFGFRSPGEYRENVDCSALPDGVYYSVLIVDGARVGTQRMLVLH